MNANPLPQPPMATPRQVIPLCLPTGSLLLHTTLPALQPEVTRQQIQNCSQFQLSMANCPCTCTPTVLSCIPHPSSISAQQGSQVHNLQAPFQLILAGSGQVVFCIQICKVPVTVVECHNFSLGRLQAMFVSVSQQVAWIDQHVHILSCPLQAAM